jgi:hypothetical protein
MEPWSSHFLTILAAFSRSKTRKKRKSCHGTINKKSSQWHFTPILPRLQSIPPEDYPLDARSVAKALGISPTTLYKYRFQEPIREAAQRQQENTKQTAKKSFFPSSKQRLQKLGEELKVAEERDKHLVALLTLVEANAARLGIDPEELYKPVRTVSYAGQSGRQRARSAIYTSKSKRG